MKRKVLGPIKEDIAAFRRAMFAADNLSVKEGRKKIKKIIRRRK